MIKSKVWSDNTSVPLSNDVKAVSENNGKEIWVLLASIALVSVLVEIVRPNGLQPLDLFIWRPVLIVCGLVLTSLWLKIWFKKNFDEIKTVFITSLPWALLGALVFGIIGLWPRDSGALPLTLSNLPVYFLTLGFWPLVAGPESILRGFALGLGVAIFWYEFRASKNDLRSALGGLGAWLASSLVLVLPFIVLNITVALSGGKVLSLSASDLANNFSRLNLNTFWANLQLTRWFTGFGGQLPNSLALFSLSWVFILIVVLLLIIYWRPRNVLGFLKLEDSYWPTLFFSSAIFSGLLAGWGKMHHSSLDLVAWLVFIVLLSAWFWRFKKSDGLNIWLTPLVLLAGGLLGWTVLLPVIASLLVIWIQDNFVGRNWPSWISQILLWLCLAAASLGFMRGSQYIQEGMVWVLLALGCLSIPAIVWFQIKENPKKDLGVMVAWLLTSLISSWVLNTFLVSALAALAIIVYYLFFRSKAKISQALPYLVLIYVAAVMVLAFWLPRLLNPRLLPL
jgi:hypothetical protein